jgi:hypothetical protein
MPAFLPYFDDHTQETAEMRPWYRVMIREPFVKAAFLDKVFDIEALELHVNPYEDDSDGAEPIPEARLHKNRQAAAFNQYAITKRVAGGVGGLVWSIFSGGLVDGYSICEKVWDIEQRGRWTGKYVLRELKPKDVDNDAILEVDEFRNVTAIMGLRYNAGEFFSPADFVIFEHLKFYGKPGGMSDLRAAYAAFWMLDTVKKLRMIGCEKRAMPIIWGTYRDQAQRTSLENSLSLMKSANWLATPESVKATALDIAGASHEIFRASVESLQKDIVVSISGAYLQMMEGSAGDTRGDTSEHQSTADRVKGHLRVVFLETINKQIVPDLTDLNFAGVDLPEAVQGGVDEGELAKSAAVDKLLQEMGLALSKRATYKKYGRQAPVGPDDELKPAPAAAPPGGDGPPEFDERRPEVPAPTFRGQTDWGDRVR